MPADGKALVERFEKLKGDRSSIDSDVQAIADLMLPRKSTITSSKTPGIAGYSSEVIDMTGSQANQVLAAGIVTNSTPSSGSWMAFDPPDDLTENGLPDGGEESRWCQRITGITFRELAKSNFYEEIHEAHLERNPFGTCCLYVEESDSGSVRFESLQFGKYVIAENHEGRVDTVFREMELTTRQAVQKFGKENLGEKLSKAAESGKNPDRKWTFYHCVYPRLEREMDKDDKQNKPWASCYVSKDDKHLVKEDGYDEMPFAVCRFLKWPGTVWGYGPGFDAQPEMAMLNRVRESMIALGEVQAWPRILLPESYGRNPDMSAAGITLFNPNEPNAKPTVWGTEGRFDIGVNMMNASQKFVKDCFFNDLFQMFANIEAGKLTAYEASQRVAEKLDLFSPTFQLITSELLTPALMRVFAILLRAGKFPQPPEGMLQRTPDGQGFLKDPRVVYTSKLALAIRALENRSFMEFANTLQAVAQMKPDVVDWVDWDRAIPGLAKNYGTSSAWINSERNVKAMRQQRAQQMAAQQQLAAAESATKSAKQLGGAPPQMQEAAMSAMGAN